MIWERIELKKGFKTATSLKGNTTSHITTYSVRAQVVEKQRDKILENGSMQSVRSFDITLRKSSETDNIDEHWRIGYRGQDLTILSIAQTQDRRFYMLKCLVK